MIKLQEKHFGSVLSFYSPFLKKYTIYIFFNIFFNTVSQIIKNITVINFISDLTDNYNTDNLSYYLLYLVSSYIIQEIFKHLGKIYGTILYVTLLSDIRLSLYAYTQTLSFRFLGSYSPAFLENLIDNTTHASKDLFKPIFEELLPFFINTIVLVVNLYSKNKLYAFISLAWLFIYSIIRISNSFDLSNIFKLSSLWSSNRASIFLDYMSNYYMRRIFQLENYSVKKISQVYNEELGYYSNYLKSNYNMNKISNIISYIYRICFIWFIFKFDTNITIGSSIVIMEMNNEMLNNFMDNLDNILDITEALGDLWEALNQLKKAQVYHPQGTEIVHKIDGKISIKNLNFSFGNKKIFNNFSIEIPSGCKVAVIGTSGVGKSTLLGILSKLHEVNRNSVFIDDEDICNLDPTSIRNNIIYITQANSLLDSTINENILIGKIDATREEIERAATLAECNFINKLPQGYNTPVGTNGSNLSGGQIQRICIARSIVDFKKLNNSKLILCDEPISALDPFTAKAIIDKIIHIGDKKTMLWVDHSMHIAPLCDLVIMMTQDGIITGSHTDLMYKSSKYRQLFYPDSKNDITQNML